MKKWFALLVFLIFLTTGALAVWAYDHPKYIINTLLKELTPQKPLQCKEASWQLSPIFISCRYLEFDAGEPHNSHWIVKIEEILIKIDWRPFSEGLSISKIEIKSPDVTLRETPPIQKSNTSRSKSEISILPVNNVQIIDGVFRYQNVVTGDDPRVGEIEFTDIFVNIPRPTFKNKWNSTVRINASGKLGKGEITVSLHIHPQSSPINFEMFTDISTVILADVNGYTEPSEGIALKGVLLKGKSSSIYNGQKLTSQTRVSYEKLQIGLSKNRKGSLFKRTLEEIIFNSLLCDNQTPSDMKKQNTTSVLNERTGSWAQFVLTGLLKSAIKAACVKREIKV